MIKYATAIRTRTASTEAILQRFMQANAIHPTYQPLIELGRAQNTIFLCRYLRDRDLQREINEGLNVVESWNRGVQIIFFGKGGDIPSNRRDDLDKRTASAEAHAATAQRARARQAPPA